MTSFYRTFKGEIIEKLFKGISLNVFDEKVISRIVYSLFIILSVVGVLFSYTYSNTIEVYSFGVLAVLFVITLYLHKIKETSLSILGVSILPVLLLIIYVRSYGSKNIETWSFFVIPIGLLPFILEKEIKYWLMFVSLAINLFVFLCFHQVFRTVDEIISGNPVQLQAATFSVSRFTIWLSVAITFYYNKRKNNSLSERLDITNGALNKFCNQFYLQNEELLDKDQVIREKQKKIYEQSTLLEKSNNELGNTKSELLKTIDRLQEVMQKLNDKESESKSLINALNEHYKIVQFDLRGNVYDLNAKMQDFLEITNKEKLFKEGLRSEFWTKYGDLAKPRRENIRLWKKIKEGASFTQELEFTVAGESKNLATTFAPVLDSKGKPIKILAIGQDVTELRGQKNEIDKINFELKEKIEEIRQQNEMLSFQQKEIFDKNEELKKQKEEIQTINDSLEERVQERTQVLQKINKQLSEYAFINSHVLRGPVSTILGLINLISYSKLNPEDKLIVDYLKETTQILDGVVERINKALDQGSHFDRQYLRPSKQFNTDKILRKA